MTGLHHESCLGGIDLEFDLQYAISQLHLVRSSLHLVTYLSHCSKGGQLNDDVTSIGNNRQVCVTVLAEVFVISRIASSHHLFHPRHLISEFKE